MKFPSKISWTFGREENWCLANKSMANQNWLYSYLDLFYVQELQSMLHFRKSRTSYLKPILCKLEEKKKNLFKVETNTK